jgi:hypothetical protein
MVEKKQKSGGNSMNEEYKEREEQKNVGLTTAALAGVRERTAATGVLAAGVVPALATDEQAAPLLSPDEAKDFRARWDAIQVGFVDEPRRAVEQADSLVAGAMKRLAEMFADERAKLEGQWDRGNNVSTEDLRLALRRYRSFFGRLLSV